MRAGLAMVRNVTLLPRSPAVKAARLDSPKAGESSPTYDIRLTGWVVGEHEPVVALEVWQGDERLRTFPAQLRRDDIKPNFPDHPHAATCGFSGRIGLVPARTEFELLLTLVLRSGATVPFATITGRRSAWTPPGPAPRSPLLLTSVGRTGTTWVTRLLGSHPDVVTFPRYPYETMVMRYWLHSFAVLAQPEDADAFSRTAPQRHPTLTGPNPFYDETGPPPLRWIGSGYVESLAAFTRSSIDTFYEKTAAYVGKPDARMFVEKTPADRTPRLAAELYPDTREIFLVRDFRDMYASVRAFNEKRGTPDFGRDLVSSDEEHITMLARGAARHERAWRDRNGSATLLRYEDLAADPVAALCAVFQAIGLDADPALVARVIKDAETASKELGQHRTTVSTEASIGRWRTDLPPDVARHANEAFGPSLEGFGYPL